MAIAKLMLDGAGFGLANGKAADALRRRAARQPLSKSPASVPTAASRTDV